jgi:hypothetical protein
MREWVAEVRQYAVPYKLLHTPFVPTDDGDACGSISVDDIPIVFVIETYREWR